VNLAVNSLTGVVPNGPLSPLRIPGRITNRPARSLIVPARPSLCPGIRRDHSVLCERSPHSPSRDGAVPSGGSAQTKSRKETPDLRKVVAAGTSLAVKVKTPTNVGSGSHAMTASEAATAVSKAPKEAVRQLGAGLGMLVVGDFNRAPP